MNITVYLSEIYHLCILKKGVMSVFHRYICGYVVEREGCVCVLGFMYVYMYVCLYVWMSVCIYVYIVLFLYVCMCG